MGLAWPSIERLASVETVQGWVPTYSVKETLMVMATNLPFFNFKQTKRSLNKNVRSDVD